MGSSLTSKTCKIHYAICDIIYKQRLTLSQTTNFALFQTERVFKFDENGRTLFKWVENSVGKGEIARYEQFLLFQQCFQETCTADT